ncbi:MAG: amylo-alpha-1,6-glucosidase [Candidatus Micrarchaeota archaeon]|nr:amylo-alpha-1,6-glucosidase [Candidatus Micrarchaeota archaeon]
MIAISAFDLVPSQAKYLEWLIASGNGAYASSTVIGMNSRKYHGILVAPLGGSSSNRHVMLSKLEEEAVLGEKTFPLSTNSYPGTIYPTGYKFQTGFSFHHHPTFYYSIDSTKLEKSVRMLYGKSTAVVSYRVVCGEEVTLKISPLLAPRQIHADRGKSDLDFTTEKAGFRINSPANMVIWAHEGTVKSNHQKYYDMTYEIEKERGYYYTENLACPGTIELKMGPKEEAHIIASLEDVEVEDALRILDKQAVRFEHLKLLFKKAAGIELTDFAERLLIASDAFVVATEKHKGIIAGFPWFSEWARDAMIALPGLLLCTGRYSLAREVLLSWARMMQDGLIPNFIDENEFAHYTSADASLWFINAAKHYLDHTHDENFTREHLWKYIRQIIASYVEGNRLVRMDQDGLIYVAEPASTWMDAKVNGVAVTPRKGKPVEINALWYSGLSFALELAEKFEDRKTADLIRQIIDQVEMNFQKFVSTEGWLFDVIEPNDASFRPNQIFAVALSKSPLNSLQQKYVFNAVRSKLYTPLGLKTLASDDSRYCENYRGGPQSRDWAYHQGMIWPWLLGPFYDAQLKVYPGSHPQILASLKPIAEKMSEGCIGSLPELYEPSTAKPAGAPSQAWSVAEILRIYVKIKRELLAKEQLQQKISQ